MRRALLTCAAVLTASAAPAEEVTFNKHVAPILWKNCASCHRPGEVGPFSLVTYALILLTFSRRGNWYRRKSCTSTRRTAGSRWV